jgi:hypothetical protein
MVVVNHLSRFGCAGRARRARSRIRIGMVTSRHNTLRLILCVAGAFGTWILLLAGQCEAQTSTQKSASATEIWFSPQTKEVSPDTKKIDYSTHDFSELLKPDAPWQQAALRTAVLILPANTVWSYPDRPAVVRFFKDHNFRVGFSFGMLSNSGNCPVGVEGISQDTDFNHEAVTIARLWKEAGGRLDVVAMDAPLGYGHFLEPICRMPIAEVARRAAATLARIRSYFPNVEIVDAEGAGRLENPVWFEMMENWFREFYQQSGQKIDAVALDLHWQDLRPGNSLEDTSRRAAAFFRAHQVRTGLIINSHEHGPTVTDAQWMEANRRHIGDAAHLGLDFLFIAGWMGHPKNNLPDSNPSSYTSLVDFADQTLHHPD